MRVSDFHFDLPEELIAQSPPPVRGTSRMLRLDRRTGEYSDDFFRNLPEILRPGDLLILNDSRVIPARLYATRAGLHTQHNSPHPSGRIEVLLTQHLGGDDWSALVRPSRKVQPGEHLHFAAPNEDRAAARPPRSSPPESSASAHCASLPRRISRPSSKRSATCRCLPTSTAATTPKTATATRQSFLTNPVRPPLPPPACTSRRRFSTSSDKTASRSRPSPSTSASGPSSPSAPKNVADIHLHAEHYTLPAATATAINAALAEGRRIIAAGTTTTRTLEHCAQLANTDPFEPHTGLRLHPHSGSTEIFISPGHKFRVVSGLLTNFHLPQSTLLMLVSAFAGREAVLAAYAHAVRERYRFFSYGDCMLLL